MTTNEKLKRILYSRDKDKGILSNDFVQHKINLDVMIDKENIVTEKAITAIEELYKDYVSKEEVEMSYVKADFYVMCEWWLKHYEGLEHMLEGGKSSPETMYTITAILGRCFNKLKNGETKAEAFGINSKENNNDKAT